MAAEEGGGGGGGVPDEGPKLSLLDSVLRAYSTDIQARCTRALIIGRLAQGATFDSVRSFHEAALSQGEGAGPTGLLLVINGRAMVHLVEVSSSEDLLALLRQLAAAGSPLASASVAAFSEEVLREYALWHARAAAAPEEPEYSCKELLASVFAVHRGLLEVGRETASLDEDRARELVASNKSQFTARVPSCEAIYHFMAQVELFSVQDFLGIYDNPIDFVSESERVWPVEPLLRF